MPYQFHSELFGCRDLGDHGTIHGFNRRANARSAVASPRDKARSVSSQFTQEGMMGPFQSLSWYALHTRPQQEERSAQNLIAPGVWKPWCRSCKRRESLSVHRSCSPAISFARFDVPSMFHKIRFTRGVLYVVSFAG